MTCLSITIFQAFSWANRKSQCHSKLWRYVFLHKYTKCVLYRNIVHVYFKNVHSASLSWFSDIGGNNVKRCLPLPLVCFVVNMVCGWQCLYIYHNKRWQKLSLTNSILYCMEYLSTSTMLTLSHVVVHSVHALLMTLITFSI